MRKTFLFALMMTLGLSQAWAFRDFVVRDIQVEGLKRIPKGTVYNYMEFAPGETLTRKRAAKIVRELYETGLFSDIGLDSRGTSTLVVTVEERPIISKFDLKGNSKLGGEELKQSLADAGLGEGKQFKKSLLAQIEQQIRRQYYANGHYGVRLRSDVTEKPGNKVDIEIKIHEGEDAEIRHINFVGNTVFSDEELLEIVTLTTPGFGTWFNSNEQYSQEKLRGDLEKVVSHYQDRGYLNFDVLSANVSISPDRVGTYITVRVNEGPQYKLGNYTIGGKKVLSDERLNNLVAVKKGDVFSLGKARRTAKNITDTLAVEGYAFAKVDVAQEPNEETKTVDLTFLVNPGKKVYVRRIEFNGNLRTNDETLRREMRFFEGGPFSAASMELSRARLGRLPYVGGVKVETARVPGSDDLLDIKVEVQERPPGSFQFGVGFSANQGFLLNSSVTHNNFLGTGSRLGLELNRSETSQFYNLSFSDPYFTDEGIGQSFSVFFRKTDAISTTFSSRFATDVLGARLSYSWPISENARIRVGGSVRETAMKTFTNSSSEVLSFVTQNGSNFTDYSLLVGLSYDDRNRSLFATKGSRHRLTLEAATPVGDLEFYQATYRGEWMLSFGDYFLLEADLSFAYAKAYGDTTDIPPYERYFAGGPSSVRGFESASLGPRDSNGNPFGGSVRTVGQFELMIPTGFETDNKTTRLVAFYDVGNVFEDIDSIEPDELRSSAGIAFYWMTPILGVMRFSYGIPLSEKAGDDTDSFQFSFGVGF